MKLVQQPQNAVSPGLDGKDQCVHGSSEAHWGTLGNSASIHSLHKYLLSTHYARGAWSTVVSRNPAPHSHGGSQLT